MSDDDKIRKPFLEFAGPNGDYYADTFLSIQKSELGRWHLNKAALVGSFIWAALRGNWLLFLIGFLIDLVALVNLGLVYKYAKAAADNADKDFLVARYEGWTQTHIIGAILVFVLGRLIFAWLSDRLYMRQYERWRVDRTENSGVNTGRLVIVAVVAALVVPLMLYRSTQFAPEERACIKQSRAIASGEEVGFKDRFDCTIIGEFPTLIWIDRPDRITYPRGEDGERIVKRTPASEGAPPVSLNSYVSQAIDDGIGYLTVFYGFLFDGITNFLRGMLGAIAAVFVGTPWPIAMVALLLLAYKAPGRA